MYAVDVWGHAIGRIEKLQKKTCALCFALFRPASFEMIHILSIHNTTELLISNQTHIQNRNDVSVPSRELTPEKSETASTILEGDLTHAHLKNNNFIIYLFYIA